MENLQNLEENRLALHGDHQNPANNSLNVPQDILYMAQRAGKDMENRIRGELDVFSSQVQGYIDAGNQRSETRIKHNEEILNSIQELQSVQTQNTDLRLKEVQQNIYKVTGLLYETLKDSIDSQEKSLKININQLNDKFVNAFNVNRTELINEIITKNLAKEQHYIKLEQELALQKLTTENLKNEILDITELKKTNINLEYEIREIKKKADTSNTDLNKQIQETKTYTETETKKFASSDFVKIETNNIHKIIADEFDKKIKEMTSIFEARTNKIVRDTDASNKLLEEDIVTHKKLIEDLQIKLETEITLRKKTEETLTEYTKMHEALKKTTEDTKTDQDKKMKTMTNTINQYTTEIEKFKKNQLEFNSFKETQMKVNGELKDIISKKDQVIDLENQDVENYWADNADDKPADRTNIKVIANNGKLAFINLTTQDLEAIDKQTAKLVVFEPPLTIIDKGVEITTYNQFFSCGYEEAEADEATKLHVQETKKNLTTQTKTTEQIQEVESIYTIKRDGPNINIRKYPNTTLYRSQLSKSDTNLFLRKENEYTKIIIKDEIKAPEEVIKTTEVITKPEEKPTQPPTQPIIQEKIVYVNQQQKPRFAPRTYRNNNNTYNYNRPTYDRPQNTYRYNNTGFNQDRYRPNGNSNYRNNYNYQNNGYQGYENRPNNYRNQGYYNKPNNYRNQGYYYKPNNYNNKGYNYNNNKAVEDKKKKEQNNNNVREIVQEVIRGLGPMTQQTPIQYVPQQTIHIPQPRCQPAHYSTCGGGF